MSACHEEPKPTARRPVLVSLTDGTVDTLWGIDWWKYRGEFLEIVRLHGDDLAYSARQVKSVKWGDFQ